MKFTIPLIFTLIISKQKADDKSPLITSSIFLEPTITESRTTEEFVPNDTTVHSEEDKPTSSSIQPKLEGFASTVAESRTTEEFVPNDTTVHSEEDKPTSSSIQPKLEGFASTVAESRTTEEFVPNDTTVHGAMTTRVELEVH
uniref:Uncharacterized protein n=1 Tax=Heterorhabditis bacteriophora TaxID=37862 RepID=A0A1I7XFI1_HETBA